MASSLLLKNGLVLIHSEDEHVQPTATDVLIEGNTIAKVAPNITAGKDVEVIDCTNKIISPGFIDTHHHVWQTQLRGRHADQTLLQYMPSGNLVGGVFEPEDVFWGQLGGCLEMLNAGTTSVADFAHINYSPDHNHAAISATAASGIRSVFGYCVSSRLASANPLEIEPNGMRGHALPTFDELAKTAPWGNGRVTLGISYDGFPYTPKEYVDLLMSKCEAANVNVIQAHIAWKPGKPSQPQAIEKLGILDSRFLMSHSNMSKEDADLYRKRGVHYSSTPSSELQMSMALPVVAFNDDLGVKDLGSIGVDSQAINSTYIPGEARLGLQSARAYRGKLVESEGKTPRSVGPTVEEAFNLCTILGARALKQSDRIGSIAEGKLADLVIFDADSPAMVCGSLQDPVAAIMLHSSPADVETVIVDGVVRKRAGKLVDVLVEDDVGEGYVGSQTTLQWSKVASELVRTREKIAGASQAMDMQEGEKKIMAMFGMSEDELVNI